MNKDICTGKVKTKIFPYFCIISFSDICCCITALLFDKHTHTHTQTFFKFLNLYVICIYVKMQIIIKRIRKRIFKLKQCGGDFIVIYEYFLKKEHNLHYIPKIYLRRLLYNNNNDIYTLCHL